MLIPWTITAITALGGIYTVVRWAKSKGRAKKEFRSSHKGTKILKINRTRPER